MKSLKKVNAFVCTDDEIFLNEGAAKTYQRHIANAAIDSVMKEYSIKNPAVHYPNLSISLIPFMNENAAELIKALKLAL